jgi:hypothetical protein
MISLLVVGDGPRDEATVPALVAGILGIDVVAVFRAWKSLRV